MFSPDQWAASTGVAFYNGVATQSLRFDDGSSAYLSKSFGTSNRKTGTYSIWIKRSNLSLSTGANILSGGDATTNDYFWGFTNTDTLQIRNITNNSYNLEVFTQRVFRDTSAWYNIVVVQDTTQSTTNDRLKIYINGVQDTNLTYTTMPSQNADTSLNLAGTHYISKLSYANQSYIDGYIAEVNFIDGTAYDASYFGEFKNACWVPIDTSGLTFGTNGFRLQFNQTGTGTASSSTIGADTSGNANHFSSSGIVASDCNMPDCPENNFCTFNSVGRRYGQSYVATFSEGNLKATNGGNATHIWGSMAINQIASQGGVYFEIRIDSLDTARTYMGVIGDNGSDNKNSSSNGASYTYPIKGLVARSLYGYFATDSTSIDLTTGNTTFGAGDVAGIAILSDGKFFMHRNGTYLKNASGNTGDPSTGTNEIATIDLTEGDWVPYAGYNSSFSINFGQDGSFSGNETSGGYQDANGIGDFMFSVPTNCLAICSSNMAEPTISPNAGDGKQSDDYFNTALYTGTNATQSITGVGFQPDWVWLKSRSNAQNHRVFDVIRGTGEYLETDTTDAEGSSSTTLTSFDSDGFSLGGSSLVNTNTYTYVSWNWKAGGTAVSNTDGTITSSVSANTDAGFSIVTYTGTGVNATVGHGLGVAPNYMIIKSRDSAVQDWTVYSEEIGNTKNMALNTTGAEETATTNFNSTSPTSTVFSIGTRFETNESGAGFVAYCFHDVEGYSKFGSYTGNGSTDGTFVYTGFRPAWLMVKRSAGGTGDWNIADAIRSPENEVDEQVQASANYAESTIFDFDFLSNGFKPRTTDGARNGSGSTYIYMAFAENPFKYANAR